MQKPRNYGLLNALSMMFLPFAEWLEANQKAKEEREAKEKQEREARQVQAALDASLLKAEKAHRAAIEYLLPPRLTESESHYVASRLDHRNNSEWGIFGMCLYLNACGQEYARNNPIPDLLAGASVKNSRPKTANHHAKPAPAFV